MRTAHLKTYARAIPESEIVKGCPINPINALPDDVALIYSPFQGLYAAVCRRYEMWGLPSWMRETEQGTAVCTMLPGEFSEWLARVEIGDRGCFFDPWWMTLFDRTGDRR